MAKQIDPTEALRVISVAKLASLLGVSSRTLDRMKQRGDMPPAVQLSTRRYGYRLGDIKAWLDKRQRPG